MPPWSPLISKRPAAGGHNPKNYSSFIESDGSWFYWGTNDDRVWTETEGALVTGEWVHLAASHDGVDQVDLYLNGSHQVTLTTRLGPIVDGNLVIGVGLPTPADFGAGCLDDFRMYTRALSAEEVQELIKGTLPNVLISFEEGSGAETVDSNTGDVIGSFESNSDASSADVAVLESDQANNFAADFRGGGTAIFNSEFGFVNASGGGHHGDSTLEFLISSPAGTGHSAIITAAPGLEFHVFWGASFTEQPGSDRWRCGDYDRPKTAFGDHGQGVPLDASWHQAAIVRTQIADDPEQYQWDWYYDGVLNTPQPPTTTGPLPVGDGSATWGINNGRGFPSNGLIDEIRMTSWALTEGEVNTVLTPTPDDVSLNFEPTDGGAGEVEITESAGNAVGIFTGDAGIQTDDVPTLASGEPNNGNADFRGDGFATISAYPFAFHDASVGGYPGGGTVEWLQSTDGAGHQSVFWTNAADPVDANRFNIFYGAEFTGIEGSNTFLPGDFRDISGALSDVGTHGSGIPLE